MLNINTPEELFLHARAAYNMTECTGCTGYFEELIEINSYWWTPESAELVREQHNELTEMMNDAIRESAARSTEEKVTKESYQAWVNSPACGN
jgi:hypothetical protein